MRQATSSSSSTCLRRRIAQRFYTGDERLPGPVHFDEGVPAGARQLVVLARRTIGRILDRGAHESVRLETAQDRIHGPVTNHQAVVSAEDADDVVSVESISIEGVEDCELQCALAELCRPAHGGALYVIAR